jgi:hypothetical protein
LFKKRETEDPFKRGSINTEHLHSNELKSIKEINGTDTFEKSYQIVKEPPYKPLSIFNKRENSKDESRLIEDMELKPGAANDESYKSGNSSKKKKWYEDEDTDSECIKSESSFIRFYF